MDYFICYKQQTLFHILLQATFTLSFNGLKWKQNATQDLRVQLPTTYKSSRRGKIKEYY